jgi:hypothetical protein
LVNVLVVIEVWRWQGVHPFSMAIAKPLIAAAATLVAQLAVGHVVPTVALRVVLVLLTGLATYLTALASLGLSAEDRRLLTSARTRIRAWR